MTRHLASVFSLFTLFLLVWPSVAMAGNLRVEMDLPNHWRIAKVEIVADPSVAAERKQYDQRDVAYLRRVLATRTEHALAQTGVMSPGGDTLRLTLISLTPNRPTAAQLQANPALSVRSFGLGGATFVGELVAPNGQVRGRLKYGWHSDWIGFAAHVDAWHDASKAFRLFAGELGRMARAQDVDSAAHAPAELGATDPS